MINQLVASLNSGVERNPATLDALIIFGAILLGALIPNIILAFKGRRILKKIDSLAAVYQRCVTAEATMINSFCPECRQKILLSLDLDEGAWKKCAEEIQ